MQIEELGPYQVAYIHHVGPYMNVGPLFDELTNWCIKHELMNASTLMIGISFDDPATTPAEKLRYDACIVVPPETKGDGVISRMEIPKGLYATATHVGSYRGIYQAFLDLYAAMKSAGIEERDAGCIELYVDDPSITPHDEIRTVIGIAVHPVAETEIKQTEANS